MKFLRVFFKIILGLAVFVLIILLATVTTLDYTPYQQMDYYREWKQSIAQVTNLQDDDTHPIQAGWAKENITPASPVPMAGYGNRWGKSYQSVHDSIYVRALAFDNGATRAVLIVADLLIVPPTITEALKKRLPEVGLTFDQVFLGATHSHSSIGGWGDTITGRLFAGKYDPAIVEQITSAMIRAIRRARQNQQAVQIGYFQVKDTLDIINRLRGLTDTTIDPWVRNLMIENGQGQRALLSTYAAHATVLDSRTLKLSRDYAGALVDSLEQGEADFALYMAGAVGSMGPQEVGLTEFEQVGHQADGVEAVIQSRIRGVPMRPVSQLQAFTTLLPLRDPRPRLNQKWALRSWVFRWAFGDYPSFVKALRIGNIVMIGLPCDFSGELMADLSRYAASKNLHLIVTSFNGGYAGYITADRHFDKNQYETITMSWFGPYNGAYFQEVVRDVIDKLAP